MCFAAGRDEIIHFPAIFRLGYTPGRPSRFPKNICFSTRNSVL